MNARTETDADAAWLADRAIERLKEVFRSVDVAVVPHGRRLTIASRTIDLHVRIEDRTRQRDRYIIGAAFGIDIEGAAVPALGAGVVGLDATADGARAEIAETWAVTFGTPIGYALAKWVGSAGAPAAHDGTAGTSFRTEVDGETIYHGSVAARGKNAPDMSAFSSEEFVRAIAKGAIPMMGDRSRFRSATVKVGVGKGAVKDGECRVNGNVSSALLDSLRQLRWPDSEGTFLYTLFLVAPPAL